MNGDGPAVETVEAARPAPTLETLRVSHSSHCSHSRGYDDEREPGPPGVSTMYPVWSVNHVPGCSLLVQPPWVGVLPMLGAG